MLPTDLRRLRVPGAPTLAPDGSLVCYALTRIDLDADAYRSELWVAPADGSSPPRKLTHGPRDTTPLFSPDGTWLAFLRAEEGGRAQLHVLPTAGGEPRRVAEHPLGVRSPAWAPDGRRIAYVAPVPEEGRYGTGQSVPPEREPPRRITTRKYRWDGVGWTIDRRPHVFVVDPLDEEAVPLQLTSGDYDHAEPAWHPAGDAVAFVSARHEGRDLDLASDVFVVPASGGEPRQVTRSTMWVRRPAFTPDGARVVFTSNGAAVDVLGRTTGLWSVPADGSAEPVRHTDEELHDFALPLAEEPARIAVDAGGEGGEGGEDDGCGVTTLRLWRGAVELARFDLATGVPTPLLHGARQVNGFDVAPASGAVAATVADAGSPGEVVVLDADGKERALTDHGGELAREVAVHPMVEIEGRADDGYPVHGWVVKPAGAGPFPVLLTIHGGPHAQYGWTFFDEAQVYASAGYAVVLGNPRGSQGYGQAHGQAVAGAVGDRDAADTMALLDAALEDPALDGRRIGVMGGSYGGLLTTLLAARSERFAAAIVERALIAFDSFTGSSDIGSYFAELLGGPDVERHAAQSPLTHAGDITCPVLIIHSEQDLRCPLEQAQRLYERLLRHGVPTEMLVFPGEGHELSRSGLPSHRVARFDAILEWWRRHLPPGERPPG